MQIKEVLVELSPSHLKSLPDLGVSFENQTPVAPHLVFQELPRTIEKDQIHLLTA
jgi:hypothetical protein